MAVWFVQVVSCVNREVPPYNCSVSISYFKLTISLFVFSWKKLFPVLFFKAAGLFFFFFCICITGYEVHMTQRPTIDLLISKWGWQWLRMWIVYQSESQWSDFHWARIWTMSCFDALIRMCACVRDVGLRRLGIEKHLYGCVCSIGWMRALSSQLEKKGAI